MESCLGQAGVDTSPSSLDCSVGKKFKLDIPKFLQGDFYIEWTTQYPPYLERDESFFSLSPGGSILALVQLLAQGFKSDHLL